jgi:hypothetical protein
LEEKSQEVPVKFKAVTGQASQSIRPPCDFQLLHAHPSSLVEDIEHTKACAELSNLKLKQHWMQLKGHRTNPTACIEASISTFEP